MPSPMKESSPMKVAMTDSSEDEEEEETLLFSVDDRVFCQDSGQHYEAVIRKVDSVKRRYFVHFLNWNSRWDTWHEESELQKATDELRLKKKERDAQQEKVSKAAAASKRKRTTDDSSSSHVKGKRRTDASNTGNWHDYCELPLTLQTILVDERERLLKLNAHGLFGVDTDFMGGEWKPARDVHILPASVTISTVFKHFVKMKKKESPELGQKCLAFCDSLAKLFEQALPVCLLYHPERAQYMAIHNDAELSEKRKTEIYGCEFLLRLFVRLPVLLEHSPPASSSRKEIGAQLVDLIRLLQKNRQACFKSKFRVPQTNELNDFEKALMVLATQPMDEGA